MTDTTNTNTTQALAVRDAAAALARRLPLYYGSGEPADEDLAQAIEDLPPWRRKGSEMGDLMSATEVLARLRIDAASEDFEGAQLGPVAVRKLLKHVAALESDRWRQLCRIHSNRADTLRRERDELAARLEEIERQAPVAWVPIHPRTGPLWSMTTGIPDQERLPHYPLTPLYTSRSAKR